MSLALLLAAPALAAPPNPIRFEADQALAVEVPTDDLFGMAQEVWVRGAVDDNAFLMAEDIVVDAPVHGDLFAMASDVRIEAPVHGDVYALSGDVVITATGSVDGHVSVLAGQLSIGGPVGGDVSAGAGLVELDAPVGGDLSLEVGQLVLGSGAAVAGDVAYQAQAPTPGLEAVVAGTVTFTEAVDEDDVEAAIEVALEEDEEPGLLASVAWWSAMRAWGYSTKLVVGFVLLALGGVVTSRAGRVLVEQPARSLGLGFTVASVLLLGSMVALGLILPFPLGLLGLVVLGTGLYVGQLVAAQAIGDRLLKQFRPDAWGSPYLSLAIGLVPLVVVCALPWVGYLAWFVATTFGLGAMWLHLRNLAKA